jgi:hypothetical protein
MAEPLEFQMDVQIKKLAQSLAQAEARVNKTATRLDADFRRTNARVSTGVAQSAAGFARLGQVTGAQRFVLQNTANQLGDIAVQLESGAAASRVFGQQLPQILGGFGALGGSLGLVAPLLGTVAALGIPLAAMFLATGKGAEEAASKIKTFEDRLDALSKAVGDYAAAVKEANIPTDELREKFGTATEAATAFLAALEKINQIKAGESLNETVDKLLVNFKGMESLSFAQLTQGLAGVDTEIETISQKVADLRSAGLSDEELFVSAGALREQLAALEQLRQGIIDTSAAYKITEEQVGQLFSLTQRLDAATGPKEIAEAARQLTDFLARATGGYENMTAAARVLYERTRAIGEEAARTQGAFDSAGRSLNDFLAGLNAAVTATGNLVAVSNGLAAPIANAAIAAWDLAAAYASVLAGQSSVESRNSGGRAASNDGQSESGAMGGNINRIGATNIIQPRRGGGGGGGGVNPLIADLEALRQSLMSQEELEAVHFQTLQDQLVAALEQKLLTQQEYNALMEEAQRQHQQKMGDLERAQQGERLSAYAGALGDLSSLMETNNKKLFAIGKAAAIAEATVSGYQAAVEAWQKGMEIGGPAVAAAFTAASIAKTGALISRLASSSIGGAGGNSDTGGGTVAPTQAGTYLNFTFTGGYSTPEQMGRFMVSSLNSAIENGAVIRGARLV